MNKNKKRKNNTYKEAILHLNDILIIIGENMQRMDSRSNFYKYLFLVELRYILHTSLTYIDTALKNLAGHIKND